jgi:hypothetical protein
MISPELRKAGATLTTMLALGGASVKAAEAAPLAQTSPEAVATHVAGYAPENVQDNEFQADALRAINACTEQWDGMILVGAPTKIDMTKHENKIYAAIDVHPAPFGKGLQEVIPGYSITVHDKTTLALPKPYICKVNGATFAAFATKDYQWAFLKLDEAQKIGAVKFFEFTDEKPGPVGLDSSTPPTSYKNERPLTKHDLSMISFQNEIHHLRPSSVAPHATKNIHLS